MAGSTTLEHARSLLNSVGYANDKLQEAFPVWDAENRIVEHASLVAFSRTVPKDMSTAVVVVHERGPEPALRAARALGAPFIVTPAASGVRLSVADGRTLVDWCTVGDLAADVSERELELILGPESASRIKVGLRRLPLFDVPVDLLVQAQTGSSESLGPIIGSALSQADSALPAPTDAADSAAIRVHREAARLVVGALTTLFLWDSSPSAPGRDSGSRPPADYLIAHAARAFPASFRRFRGVRGIEAKILRDLINQLGQGVNYRSLDSSVLCHVYEQALVDEDRRLDLGIHYTPPGLAHRMLANLPVEFIDPTERFVLDPTCGSGTLLIAAHERLSQLQPSGWSLDERHQDLRVLLHGIDIDPFACEIAQLSMLLKAQPAGNGWSIAQADTLQLDAPAIDPSIIVMNPPWRYGSEDGKRAQLADRFMRRAMEWLNPGGVLAAILPTSWLSADNSAVTRDLVAEQFDIFETWRLSQSTFATASQSPSVLMARKKTAASAQGRRVVHQVRKDELQSFYKGQAPRYSFIVDTPSVPLANVLPPLEIAKPHQPLYEVAIVRSGPQPKKGAVKQARTVAEDGDVPYLRQFRHVDPYEAVKQSHLVFLPFPDAFEGAWAKAIISSRKVLVSAKRSAENPWRCRVAIDLQGIACRESIRGIAPLDENDEDLLFALLAIFGSGFASSYIASYGPELNIPAGLIHGFPVPTSRQDIRRLGELGMQACMNAGTSTALGWILNEIEAAVWEAYGVDAAFRDHAIRWLSGKRAPEGSARYPLDPVKPPSSESTMRRFGGVLEAEDAWVRIWINGVTPSDGVIMPVPARMPGWLMRPGATFDATAVETVDDIETASFTFQPMSWQTEDDDTEVFVFERD
ncbi:MAG: N-6 DNA methylase [Acidimicrobiaceae bacterium]|nr:N-6 DNA methylase [Acidimicrobiaceae bacterium]